jgi:hypothetical protein
MNLNRAPLNPLRRLTLSPRKPAAPRVDGRRSTQRSEFDAVPPAEVLIRLVRESVAARIRHRALIEILSSESFDFTHYKETYAKLVKRDSAALEAQTLISEADFLSIFKEWHRQDIIRYGVSSPIKPQPASKSHRPRAKS